MYKRFCLSDWKQILGHYIITYYSGASKSHQLFPFVVLPRHVLKYYSRPLRMMCFRFLTRLAVFINVNSQYVLCDRKWLLIILRIIRYSRSHPLPCTSFAQPHSQLFIHLTLHGLAFHKARCQIQRDLHGMKMACSLLKDKRSI